MDGDRCGLEAFRRLVATAGVDDDAAARLHADLVARHAEPHRRYHTLRHVAHVLAALDVTAAELADDTPVRLAAWYHDAVYDPTTPGNEAASAALARRALLAHGADPELVEGVAALVVATAGHDPVGAAQAALVDADLAILGAPPRGYARYVEQVRAEYGHVDDDAWRAGRGAVLRGFLGRDRIFHHPAMADAAVQARRNLGAELAGLEGGEPSG